MKKIFVLGAIAALMFTACNEIENPLEAPQQQMELSVNSASVKTKGYVEGATFVDSPYDKLHGQTPDGKTDRTMMLSAYLTPQSGDAGNYFVGQEFAKNANGETDDLWHHNPKVYWPLGGTLDFLAYSSTIPFEGTALKWNQENAASEVILYVKEAYMQDDIIYGAVRGRQSAAGDPSVSGAPVDMTFNHTQAWIEFQVSVADDSMNDIVALNDITIENLFTQGELTLKGGATPSYNWDFVHETPKDFPMADTYSICGSLSDVTPVYVSDEVGYMDMLVPQQGQTAFVMHYQLLGQDTVLEYRFDLTGGTWTAGNKYIYEIIISPYEITVNPSVTPFTVVNPGITGWDGTLE